MNTHHDLPITFKSEKLVENEKLVTEENGIPFNENDHYYWYTVKPFYTMITEGRLPSSKVKLLSHDKDEERHKEFFSFNSYDTLWKLVSERKTRYFHEVFSLSRTIKENVFTSIFYDMEKKLVDSEEEEDMTNEETILRQIIEEINEQIVWLILKTQRNLSSNVDLYKNVRVKVLIQNSSGYCYTKSTNSSSSSSSEKTNSYYKLSFHVNVIIYLKSDDKTIQLIVFENINEVRAVMIKALSTINPNLLDYLTKNTEEKKQNIVDFSIYAEGKSLRCLYCSNRDEKKRSLEVDSYKKYILLKGGDSGFIMEEEDEDSNVFISNETNEDSTYVLSFVKDLSKLNPKEIFYDSLSLKPLNWIRKKSSTVKKSKVNSCLLIKGEIKDEEEKIEMAAETKISNILRGPFETCFIYYSRGGSKFNNHNKIVLQKDWSSSDNLSITKRKVNAIHILSTLLQKWIDENIKKINKGKVCSGNITFKSEYSIIQTGAVEKLKHFYDLKTGKIVPTHPNDHLMLQFTADVMKRLCIDYHYCVFESTYKFCFINNSGQEHHSNHVYFIVDLWSQNDKPKWYQKCHDENCINETLKNKNKNNNNNSNKQKDGKKNKNTYNNINPKGKSQIFEIPKEDLINVNQIKNIFLEAEIFRYTNFLIPQEDNTPLKKLNSITGIKRPLEGFQEEEEEKEKEKSKSSKKINFATSSSSLSVLFNKF